MKITILWSIAFILTAIFAAAAQAAQSKAKSSKESWSQFECGFNVMNPPQLPFSFQFFMVSLLFLIFDVEITLILSFPSEPASQKNVIMTLVFLLVLTIGLLYEWQKSKIKWSE